MKTLDVHLVLRKEDLRSESLDDGKIVVVFDALLATSTIVSCLYEGAAAVLPVDGQSAAMQIATQASNEYIVAGELNGRTIEGFKDPLPLQLRACCRKKLVILATTNGTVAIRKALPARLVFMGALLNNAATSSMLLSERIPYTLIIVCAGSAGNFNIEDFYSAGHLLLTLSQSRKLVLNDAALAARMFAEKQQQQAMELF